MSPQPKSSVSYSSPLVTIDRARRNGWSIVQIAKAAGIERGQVVRVVKGRTASTETLAALARFAPMASSPPPL